MYVTNTLLEQVELKNIFFFTKMWLHEAENFL